MSFFQTAREYTEGFSLYGTRLGVEWPATEGEPLRVHELGPVRAGGRGRAVAVSEITPPDRVAKLPGAIAPFVQPHDVDGVRVQAHHGGSHPHLVHEFISSITEGRAPSISSRTAANWTGAGISAHASALADGAWTRIPDYTEAVPK